MLSKSRIKMGRYEAKWQSDEEDIQEGSLNGGGVARLNLEEEILTSFSSLLHFPENKAEQGSLWRSFTGTQDFVVEPTPATRPERQFVYVNIHYILFILVAMKLNTFFRSRLLPFHLPSFVSPTVFWSFSLPLLFSLSLILRPRISVVHRRQSRQPASQSELPFHGNRRSPLKLLLFQPPRPIISLWN